MTDTEYEPSPWDFVADTVDQYEETGGKEGGTLEGKPVVILTTRGRRTGQLRKTPLKRVEHDGDYAVVGSMGGAPKDPVWVHNLRADPNVTFQDGAEVSQRRSREVTGDEKREWWAHAVAAWPSYDDYQKRTDRQIPVFVLERTES
jgi:deazaflavin-dependent oxidoreductase (nitroreductase family)